MTSTRMLDMLYTSKNTSAGFLKINFILPVAKLQKHSIQTYQTNAKEKK